MTNTINVKHDNKNNANFIYTFAKINQNLQTDLLNQSTLSTLLKGSKKMQVKLRNSFAEKYATKKIKLNTMSMFILQLLTPYTDINMEIRCDLEHLRVIAALRRETFDLAIKQLLSMGFLEIDSEGKYYVTKESHILVTPFLRDGEKNTDNYLADYKILNDPKQIKGLKQDEHRLLYFLVLQCASSPVNCYTPLVTRLYKNKRSRTESGYARTHLNSFEDLVKALITLWRKDCIAFTLVDDQKQFKVEYSAIYAPDKAKSVEELYSQLLDLLYSSGFNGKFDGEFVKNLKLNITCELFQIDNDSSKTEIEGYLKTYASNYNLQTMFADKDEFFNIAANPANLIINFKKELGVLVGPKLACELYSSTLESYVSNNASTLRYYVLHDKAVSQYKDYYLMKKIEDLILEQLKIFTILHNAELPIDDTIQLKGIRSEITDSQFNNLIRYYAAQANRNHIIYFVDKLESIVANFKTKNESDFMAFLDMLTNRYDGLTHLFGKYFDKVRLMYATVVTENELDMSILEFKQALPLLLRTVGSTNTDTLKSYIEDIIKAHDYDLRAIQVAETVEKYEQQLITNVTQLPLELVTIAKSRGVHDEFFAESPTVINKYYDEIFAVKKNDTLTADSKNAQVTMIKDQFKREMHALIAKYVGYDELCSVFTVSGEGFNSVDRPKVDLYNWLVERG